jgi:hypothetical protein
MSGQIVRSHRLQSSIEDECLTVEQEVHLDRLYLHCFATTLIRFAVLATQPVHLLP